MFKNILYKIRLILNKILKSYIRYPPYNKKIHNKLISTDDPIRYTTLALALNNLNKNNINGCIAEVGVYKGNTSKIIHNLSPERKMYLFDTYEGFPSKYLNKEDKRFQDTNVDILKKKIGIIDNIVIKIGIFPETTKGLENEKFSFVMIDLDIYEPTMAALDFFYSRMNSGGYIFLHDYNNPKESDGAVYKAVNKFFKDKSEKIIEIPDKWGSIVIRKV